MIGFEGDVATIVRAGQTCDIQTAQGIYRDCIMLTPYGYNAIPTVGTSVVYFKFGPQKIFVIGCWSEKASSVSAGRTRVTNTVSFDNNATFAGKSTSLLHNP